MMAATIVLWLAACGACFPGLLKFLLGPLTASEMIILTVMMLFFSVFWLFGAYHIVAFVFNDQGVDRPTESTALRTSPKIPVALLYTTMNDFDPIALASCLAQDYDLVHVFILDDSTGVDIRTQIDVFATAYADRITIIRRPHRSGQKAGNLNYALRTLVQGFPVFGIVDADTVLSPSFVRELLPALLADESLAYVQSSCRSRTDLPSAFARGIAPSLDLMWSYYMPYRMKYGFVPFLGKGALIRRGAWIAAGGFPELIAEDVAFSLVVRQHGFRGGFLNLPLVSEGVPSDQAAFTDQQCKYVVGACQLLFRARSVMFCKQLRWFEKLDVLILVAGNIVPAISFSFILLSVLVVPLVFYSAHSWTPWPTIWPQLRIPYLAPAQEFAELMDWRFRAVSVLSIAAPMITTVTENRQTWGAKAAFISRASAAHLSMLPRALVKALSMAMFRASHFASTGDRLRSPQRTLRASMILGVIGMLVSAMLTTNPQMGAVALALVLTWTGARKDSSWHRFSIPILLMLLSMVLFALVGGPAPGGGSILVPIHF